MAFKIVPGRWGKAALLWQGTPTTLWALSILEHSRYRMLLVLSL